MASKMARKQKQHYVDNKKFLQEITNYRLAVEAAKRNDEEKPRITHYLAECFLKIATHLSYRPNFINYMFKEDMISDGVENCVQYIDNFNPEKSKNPFAYFTQIIYYAFLRRIAKEKRQMDIRDKLIEKSGYEQVFHSDNNDDHSEMNSIKGRIETSMRN
jgi:DNA-directed RNA polymerase specialized sigma subunit|tara:strand:- start:872 stop:1351 length:480 start_codon:yes stop_codon:yes gene_type:complete